MARAPKKEPGKVPVNTAKLQAFEEAMKMANKQLSTETGTLIARLGDRPMDVETISTGSVVLDSITGGGFPKGRLIEVYGSEASGKTSVVLTAIGHVQRAGGNAVFIDLENALDPRYAAKLGVDVESLAVAQPDYAEQAFNLIHLLARSGSVDFIGVDSIASMVPQAEFEGDAEQRTVGALARVMSTGLRKLISVANRTGTTVVFINQTRDAIGSFSPFGTPQTTPGGKAMKFYASQRIEVKRRGQVKEGKEVIGNEVRLKVVKNKIAPPFGEGMTVLTFNEGINRAAEMVEVGPSYGVIEKPNNRTYVDAETGEVIGTSKAAAVDAIKQNPELLDRLSARLSEAIADKLFGENGALNGNENEPETEPGTEGAEGEEDLFGDEA